MSPFMALFIGGILAYAWHSGHDADHGDDDELAHDGEAGEAPGSFWQRVILRWSAEGAS